MSDNLYQPLSYQELSNQQSHALDQIVRLEKIVNDFYLPPEITESLEKYYILHWQGSHLISQMKEHTAYQKSTTYLVHQGITYKVNFLYISPWELVVSQKEQFKLSFRLQHKAKMGIVIIKKGTP